MTREDGVGKIESTLFCFFLFSHLWPVAPESRTLSDPARSTRFSLPCRKREEKKR